MAGNFLPGDEVTDDSDDDINWGGGLFLPEGVVPGWAYPGCEDDHYLLDDWAEEVGEDGWSTCDSDEDSDDIIYTDGRPVKKLFVTNFTPQTTLQDLRTVFSKFGQLTDVSILESKSRVFAFVTFEEPENAYCALQAKPKELQLHWKRLKVQPAYSWHQPRDSVTPWKRDESEVEGECHINKLNDDCMLQILKFLSIKEQVIIERVCKRWQSLSQSLWLRRSTLDLSSLYDSYGRFSVPAFRKVLHNTGEVLTSLDFLDIKSDSLSAVLPLIPHFCPNLEVLKMKEVTVNRCAISNLSAKCKHLKYLTFNSCHGLRDAELKKFLHKCQKLEYLDVSKNSVIQGSFLKSLKPITHSLVLDECNNLIMKNLLCEIAKPNCGLTFLSLNSCQSLTSLDVQQLCSSGASKLKHLRLIQYFPRLNNTSLRSLGLLTELTSLSLQFNSSVNKDVLSEICSGCSKLEELDISGCVDRDQPSNVNDASIGEVAKLPSLKKLDISYMMYSDAVLGSLARYAKGLTSLVCRGCPSISAEGIANVLARCEKLEHVDLSGCYIHPNILKDAALSVGARKDKKKLVLLLGGTRVMQSDVDEINEPLLEVNLVDRSHRHLRPDFNDDVYFDPFNLGEDDFDVYDSDDSINEEELQVLINLLGV